MRKLIYGFGTFVFSSLILTSCGPSPDDYKTEEIKSNCDCLKIRGELTKQANEVLSAEEDKTKRKALQETEDYKMWSRKAQEIHMFCFKNFKDYFGDEKCAEYKEFHKEHDKNSELYQSDWD